MGLRRDERGQAIQVGVAILLGFLVITITAYQVQVVPAQNNEIEFDHNQGAQEDLQELRNGIRNAAAQGTATSVSVSLGTRYPSRTIFVNPPPSTGQLETRPAGNISFGNAAVRDPSNYDGNPSSLLSSNHSTSSVVYVPQYSEYDRAPATTIEHTLTYNTFPGGANRTVTDQGLVSGDSLTIAVVQGDLSEQTTQSVSLETEVVSGPTESVTIEPATAGDPIELYVPTETPGVWNETLGTTYSEGENQTRVAAYDGQRITVELDRSEYQLRMALVEVGGNVSETDDYNVDQVGGTGSSSGGGSYNLSWNTTQIGGRAGASCSPNSCTYSVSQSPINFTVDTNPSVSGADVDYSIEFPTGTSGIAEFDPGTDSTNADGENTTALRETGANDGQTIYVHANSGGDGDRLRVDFQSAGIFTVSITDTNAPISPGDELVVNATIENIGTVSDAQDVVFEFDGTQEGLQNVSLGPGATQNVTFRYDTTGESEGNYSVEVSSEDDTDQTTVTLGSEPYFEVRNFQAPASAGPGDTITVNATVENTGTAQDTQTIEYRFDGAVADTTSETLAAGESSTTEFTYTIPADQTGGEFTNGVHSENDSSSGTITVHAAPTIESWSIEDNSVCESPGGGGSSNCNTRDEAIFDVDWQVSDDNENLNTVTVNLYRDSSLVDSNQTTVSGGSASGTLRVSEIEAEGYGEDYTIELVVEDNTGLQTLDSMTETANGN